MLSKNVSREERNTIEAIHAKRMLIARLGGSAVAVDVAIRAENVVPGPLRVSLIEIAR
jgi:hypothetical protein